jgi:hypothetical protein
MGNKWLGFLRICRPGRWRIPFLNHIINCMFGLAIYKTGSNDGIGFGKRDLIKIVD